MKDRSASRSPRVISGTLRGRRLRVPTGHVTRPARALVRRSVFDILQRDVEGAAWLDLYAGSGSFGIEALSRGADRAVFIENGAEGLRSLKANLEELALRPPRAHILRRSIPRVLHGRPPDSAPFDLVSMDPPFAVSRQPDQLRAFVEGITAALAGGWFSPEALLIWEEPEGSPCPIPGGFSEVDRRPFGTSRVRFFRTAATEGPVHTDGA